MKIAIIIEIINLKYFLPDFFLFKKLLKNIAMNIINSGRIGNRYLAKLKLAATVNQYKKIKDSMIITAGFMMKDFLIEKKAIRKNKRKKEVGRNVKFNIGAT